MSNEIESSAEGIDPLSDFKEGQWWVQELDNIASALGASHDQKRAVAVVHHMLRSSARTCNSHNELVVALKKIAAIEDKAFGGDWDEIEEARGIAVEALKASGEQP